MPSDLQREMVQLAEEHAKKKQEKQEKKIEKAVIKKIVEQTNEISNLEISINELEQKVASLKSQEKSSLVTGWLLERKKKKLNKLKSITPPTNS